MKLPQTVLLVTLLNLLSVGLSVADDIDFNRDVRPILSDNCFHCHGPDSKNQHSDFRLDSEQELFADLGGYVAVQPGNLENSELHHRIHSDDPDDLMPPTDSNRSLTAREKQILDQWIKGGAEYDKHWSFKPVERPPVPTVENDAWCSNPIDHFVVRTLRDNDLEPSKSADRVTLLRRASLVLTGLQPTPAEIDRFLANQSPDAYEKEVRRLLESDHYAERQTLKWLDAARYADTDGYQNDAERSNWPWRDWVIQAFRDNMPFDQFTVEQLAGDMLPDAGESQVLASAFNRNHRQNSEGGALAEEFFVENVIDRVETTFTVWQGLTMGCARCHDHKYDPLSQREFYQMFAYFNNTGERGTGKGVSANPVELFASPLVEVPDEYRKKKAAAEAELSEVRRKKNQRFARWVNQVNSEVEQGDKAWKSVSVEQATSSVGKLTTLDSGVLMHSGNGTRANYTLELKPDLGELSALRIDAFRDPAFTKTVGYSNSVNGNFVVTDVEVYLNQQKLTIAKAAATFAQDSYPAANLIDDNPGSGWAISGNSADQISLSLHFGTPVSLSPGDRLRMVIRHGSNYANHNIGKFRIQGSSQLNASLDGKGALPPAVLAAARVDADQRSRQQKQLLSKHFDSIDSTMIAAQKKVDSIDKQMAQLGFGQVPVMVMKEKSGEATPAYFLDRGSYLSPDTSAPVPRAVPAALFNGERQPADRLELARWIASAENPLTARVFVNRVWQNIFAAGIVKTSEDFGLQSENPSHPDLLDWLAAEFVDSGWDIKQLYYMILTSSTFRQSSVMDSYRREVDPQNRLLSRGPRYRLDGFAIRDMALSSAGLLDSRVGGKPVKPYQPTGLWNAVSGRANIRYNQSSGADLYRKSLYTYWKRAVNPPRQIIFDSGGREACDVNTRVTNTPLQALVLMNDVTFLEAARGLAQRVIESDADPAQRLKNLYQIATGRLPDEDVLSVLDGNLGWFNTYFSEDPEAAAEFLSQGQSTREEVIPQEEHAAYMAVAHLVLNLDETITLE